MYLKIFDFCQIVQVFDSFAGELGPGIFSKFELPVLRSIAREVKEQLKELNLDPVPMVTFLLQACTLGYFSDIFNVQL